jgi:hypothetical protein
MAALAMRRGAAFERPTSRVTLISISFQSSAVVTGSPGSTDDRPVADRPTMAPVELCDGMVASIPWAPPTDRIWLTMYARLVAPVHRVAAGDADLGAEPRGL